MQAVTWWIEQRTPEFFIDGMRKLVLRSEKCIERQGDYVEKYVCRFVAKILLPTFVCLNTWSLFLDISLCALLISRPRKFI